MKLELAVLALLQIAPSLAIYGGLIAPRHRFPYVVLLNSPKFYCAGALIGRRHVLTAAHCLMSVRAGKAIKVSLGVHEYYGNSVSDGELVQSTKFWIHENFSMPSAVNDIGVVELEKPITPSLVTQIIGIETRPDADLNGYDDEVVIAGWGHTSPGRVAKELRYTTMKLHPILSCMNYQKHYIEPVTLNHICAMKIKNLPCDGDSGTPLVTQKSQKIVGILSFVKDAENGIDMRRNDCRSNVPAVSTRISSYVDWISSKTGLKF